MHDDADEIAFSSTTAKEKSRKDRVTGQGTANKVPTCAPGHQGARLERWSIDSRGPNTQFNLRIQRINSQKSASRPEQLERYCASARWRVVEAKETIRQPVGCQLFHLRKAEPGKTRFVAFAGGCHLRRAWDGYHREASLEAEVTRLSCDRSSFFLAH